MEEIFGGVQRQHRAPRRLTRVRIIVAKGKIASSLRVKTDGELRHSAGKVDESCLWTEGDALTIVVNFNDCRLIPKRKRIDAKDITDLAALRYY